MTPLFSSKTSNDFVFLVNKFITYIYFLNSSAIHNAHHTREWLALHPQLVALDWPTKGADMNPIENIWGYLVCKLTKARTEEGKPYHACDAINANLLFELVRTEWGKLINNEVYLQSLIESMPQRLQKVIDAEGGWTRY